MSTTSLSSHHKIHTTALHRRNNSGELHVYRQARYFSSSRGPNRAHNIPSRMSLDVPTIMQPGPIILPPDFHRGPNQKQPKSDTKKHSQPSSPGSRLASFLNSLFNQTKLKKKKKKKSKPDKDFDDENAPGGGARLKRKSTGHFKIITTTTTNNNNNNNNDNLKKSSSCMHLHYAETPTKPYKTISVPPGCRRGQEIRAERKESGPWKDDIWPWKDEGADSDSSSDLFDLPSHELDFYPSGLPVYETTRVDQI